MSNAVYLVSSLPTLQFGDTPPFSLDEFRRQCEGVISESELEALEALIAGRSHSDSFVSAYYSHEIQLKNLAGKFRAAAWGQDVRFSERSFDGYDVTYAKMVSDALQKTNPLEREHDLDRARFWLVDVLSGVGSYTMAHVYAYAIKLMICERWSRLTPEAGDASLMKVINENDLASMRE